MFRVSYSKFYLLEIIFCIGIIMLVQYSAFSFQMPESTIENSEFQLDDQAKAEIKSYTELCKAVYWENMADKSTLKSNRQKYYGIAKSHLEEAIRLNPKSSYLYAKLVRILYSMGEVTRRTYSLVNKSLELNPNNPEAHFWLGILEATRGEQKAAINELKKTTELKPDHFLAQSRLARMLFDEGDYKGAASSYAEMVKLRPYIPELRLQLAKTYYMADQTEDAMREFNNVNSLSNSYLIDTNFYLAYIYARLSRTQEAIDKCLVVLHASPGNPDMNLLLGELYVSAGRYNEAISVLESVLKHGKVEKATIAEANYRLATAYKKKDEPARASTYFRNSIEIYKEAMDAEKNNAGLNYDIAMVYDAMGDMNSAEKYLQKNIDLKPDEPNAYNFLGYIYVENNVNLEKAIDLIKKAVDIQPDNGAFRDSLGWAYFKNGNVDQAIEELQKASELMPYDSDIRVHLGEVYLKKGGEFTAKALLELEKASEMKPNNTDLQRKIAELRSLSESATAKEKNAGE